MNFKIKTSTLRNNLILSLLTTDSTTINPFFSSILIDVKEDEIDLISTNFKHSSLIKITDNFKVNNIGKVLIKGRTLFDIIDKISSNDIFIEKNDEKSLQISSNNFSCELNLLDAENYPMIEFEHEGWIQFTLSVEWINKISNKLNNFTVNSTSKIGPMTGFSFDTTHRDNLLEVLATNSHHLGYLNFEQQLPKFLIIIDPETLKFINSIVSNKNKIKEITFFTNKQKIIFEIEGNWYRSTLIDGEYPTHYKVIENERKYQISFKKNELNEALKIASVVATSNDINKKPSIQLKITPKTLEVSTRTMQLGSTFQEVNLITSNVDVNFEFILNINYLEHILKALDTDVINLEFNESNKSLIFKNQNDNSAAYLVLPIRF